MYVVRPNIHLMRQLMHTLHAFSLVLVTQVVTAARNGYYVSRLRYRLASSWPCSYLLHPYFPEHGLDTTLQPSVRRSIHFGLARMMNVVSSAPGAPTSSSPASCSISVNSISPTAKTPMAALQPPPQGVASFLPAFVSPLRTLWEILARQTAQHSTAPIQTA